MKHLINSPCPPEKSPCVSCGEWRLREWQTGVGKDKVAYHFFPIHPELEISTHSKLSWNWVFVQRSSCWVIRESQHHTLTLPRGGAMLESSELWCMVSNKASDSGTSSHQDHQHCLCCMSLDVQQNRETKMGDTVAFCDVVPIPPQKWQRTLSEGCNLRIICQDLGGWRIQFFSDGERRAEVFSQKIMHSHSECPRWGEGCK